MTTRRKGRNARWAESLTDGTAMIQFIPGGFYRLVDGVLFTGVNGFRASERIQTKLLPLALRAVERPGEWVK